MEMTRERTENYERMTRTTKTSIRVWKGSKRPEKGLGEKSHDLNPTFLMASGLERICEALNAPILRVFALSNGRKRAEKRDLEGL